MKIQRYIAKNMFGTNAYLGWDEESKKAFIVDPGAEFPQAVDLIEKQGLELEYIMITHAHGDHTGGINFFRDHFPIVFRHDSDRNTCEEHGQHKKKT